MCYINGVLGVSPNVILGFLPLEIYEVNYLIRLFVLS